MNKKDINNDQRNLALYTTIRRVREHLDRVGTYLREGYEPEMLTLAANEAAKGIVALVRLIESELQAKYNKGASNGSQE